MARLRHLAVVTPDKARLVEFYKKNVPNEGNDGSTRELGDLSFRRIL